MHENNAATQDSLQPSGCLPLSLVVITYNEAANIARCLDSVPFAAEKLVIDSGSTDDTVAIARQHGARVITQPWLGFGPQRNFGSTQAQHDWILVLDADELVKLEKTGEAAKIYDVWFGPATKTPQPRAFTIEAK